MYIRMIPLLLTTVLTVLTYKSPWGTTGIERLFFSEANGWICTPSESFSSPRSKLEHFSLEQSNTDVHIYLRPICVPSILVFVLLQTSVYGQAEHVCTMTLLCWARANYCTLSYGLCRWRNGCHLHRAGTVRRPCPQKCTKRLSQSDYTKVYEWTGHCAPLGAVTPLPCKQELK